VRIWSTRDGSLRECEDDDYDDDNSDGDGCVWDAKFSPDGKHVVASTGHMLKLWNVRSSKLVKKWNANQGLVMCVTFMPNGRGLVTAGSDHSLKYWDLGNPGIELWEFFGHWVCLFCILAYTQTSDIIFNLCILIVQYLLCRSFTGWSMDLLWFG